VTGNRLLVYLVAVGLKSNYRNLLYVYNKITDMSTFCGRMQEYRLISLDRFDGHNLDSTVYMLSHNHSG
jgi:hypothetical protein